MRTRKPSVPVLSLVQAGEGSVGTELTLRSVDSCAVTEVEQLAECRKTDGEPAGWPVTAVVDDDAGVRKSLARLLSAFGYRTEVFGSAGEFLRAAPTSRPACILVDINLGDSSGLDLVRQLSVSGVRFPASAEIAIPASPIPPERASGMILKKGTAVVTGYSLPEVAVYVRHLPARRPPCRKSPPGQR